MTLTYLAGYGVAADSAIGVTLSVNGAPSLGQLVTAGYRFFVPSRFDTDTLPVTLEDYGIGGSSSVKIVEVRPSAF